MVTVVAEGQRDALLWTDVTLNNSYYKCHECTSGWTSPMNKCRATKSQKVCVSGPKCNGLFFMLWYVLPPLIILGTLAFSHYEQVYGTMLLYMSFSIRQHQKSLSLLMNEFHDNDGQMLFGEPWGPKASWHFFYRYGKTPKKPHQGNSSLPDIESGPAAWQARMLPPVPHFQSSCTLVHSG